MPETLRTSGYDRYAVEYAAYVAAREQAISESDPAGDPLGILPDLLALLGDVEGQSVLDAGCGEGYLARILADRGARVTGLDLSPRLIELACGKGRIGEIEYRVADLSEPQPELAGHFDAVASYMVLNDVEEHRGFAETLAHTLKPGGRVVIGFNNPYSYVLRRGLGSVYFETGVAHPCGLSSVGVPVSFYHRTLPEYVDAFLAAGLRLTKIVDVDRPSVGARRASGEPLAHGDEIPHFMILAFEAVAYQAGSLGPAARSSQASTAGTRSASARRLSTRPQCEAPSTVSSSAGSQRSRYRSRGHWRSSARVTIRSGQGSDSITMPRWRSSRA